LTYAGTEDQEADSAAVFMLIYCPECIETFSGSDTDPVTCLHRKHYLGRKPSFARTPDGLSALSFWEYCCKCGVFKPTSTEGTAKAKCAACGLVPVVRYWCTFCCTLSCDSPNNTGRQPFTLSKKSIPEQGCPGCSRTVLPSNVYEHDCELFTARFMSAFANCPCCDDPIGPAPSFPVMAAEFLSRVSQKDKVSVGQNILEIDDNMLVESAEGELFVISNGFSKTGPILLPKRTNLADAGEIRLYSAFYDSDGVPPGETLIVSPAIVDTKSGGWVLRKRGRRSGADGARRRHEGESG